MATIQKRKNKNGSISYKVMIRHQDGLPNIYKTFPIVVMVLTTGDRTCDR